MIVRGESEVAWLMRRSRPSFMRSQHTGLLPPLRLWSMITEKWAGRGRSGGEGREASDRQAIVLGWDVPGLGEGGESRRPQYGQGKPGIHIRC